MTALASMPIWGLVLNSPTHTRNYLTDSGHAIKPIMTVGMVARVTKSVRIDLDRHQRKA